MDVVKGVIGLEVEVEEKGEIGEMGEAEGKILRMIV